MRRRLPLAAIALAGAVLLAGCNDGAAASPGPTHAATTTTTAAAASTANAADPGAGPVSTAHIRVANFFSPGGQPGPGLDIYDVSLSGQPALPILTDVAYGTVSTYVQPSQLANNISKEVVLTALPTGEDPVAQKGDATQIGGLIDDGSAAQATIVLSTGDDATVSSSTSLIGAVSFSMRMEKGDDGQGAMGPAAPAISDGSAEILVDTSAIPSHLNPSLYLMIDSSCTPPLNGDTQIPGVPLIFNASGSAVQSQFSVFGTTPGPHQVSVVNWSSGVAPTCTQLTDLQGTTSLTLSANQQVSLYVYGDALDALHVMAAPIQP